MVQPTGAQPQSTPKPQTAAKESAKVEAQPQKKYLLTSVKNENLKFDQHKTTQFVAPDHPKPVKKQQDTDAGFLKLVAEQNKRSENSLTKKSLTDFVIKCDVITPLYNYVK